MGSAVRILWLLLFLPLIIDCYKFDVDRCRNEMSCFRPGDCGSQDKGKLDHITNTANIDSCPVIIAIRPYSFSKWQVLFRAKGLNPNDGLRLSYQKGGKTATLFECMNNGSSFEVGVGSELTKGKVYATSIGEVLTCEFIVTSSKPFIPERPEREDFVILSSIEGNVNAKSRAGIVEYELMVTCNPDDIHFDQPTSTATNVFQEVDARRHNVTCPEGWQLSYKDKTKYVPVNVIECNTTTKSFQLSKVDGSTQSIRSPFSASCTQKRCLSCPAISCTVEGCIAPNWTRGEGQNCAKLECVGNRFEVDLGGGKTTFTDEPTCLDGEWAVNGMSFTSARCIPIIACSPLSCPGCTNNTLHAACRDPKQRLRHKNRTVDGVICDDKTGKWMMNGSKEPVDEGQIKCELVDASMRVDSSSELPAAAKAALAAVGATMILGGIIGIVIGILVLRRRSKRTSTKTSDVKRKPETSQPTVSHTTASTSQQATTDSHPEPRSEQQQLPELPELEPPPSSPHRELEAPAAPATPAAAAAAAAAQAKSLNKSPKKSAPRRPPLPRTPSGLNKYAIRKNTDPGKKIDDEYICIPESDSAGPEQDARPEGKTEYCGVVVPRTPKVKTPAGVGKSKAEAADSDALQEEQDAQPPDDKTST